METSLKKYFGSLRDRVFKILPMMEAANKGQENHINEYIDGVVNEMVGAESNYPDNSAKIIEVKNLVASIKTQTQIKTIRSTVLKCTRLLNELTK